MHFSASGATNIKIKHLQHCLEILLELEGMIKLLMEKKIDITEDETSTDENEETKTYKTCFSLLKLVKTRLQHILKQLIKICSIKPPPNKDCPKVLELYKDCFKISFELRDDFTYNKLSEALCNVLSGIKEKVETFAI